MFEKAFIIMKLAYHQVFMPKNDRLQVPSFHYNASNGAPRKRHFSVILAIVQCQHYQLSTERPKLMFCFGLGFGRNCDLGQISVSAETHLDFSRNFKYETHQLN